MTDDTLIEATARALYDILEGPVANQDFARQLRQWDLALTLADAARPVIRNEALEDAAKACDAEQIAQAAKRDAEDPPSEAWAVHNYAVFVAGRNAAAIRALKEK